MRVFLLSFSCLVIACAGSSREPRPPLSNDGTVAEPEPPADVFKRNVRAAVHVDSDALGPSGQPTGFAGYGVVVSSRHVLTGGGLFWPGDTLVRVTVRSHGRGGQPTFSVPAKVISKIGHPRDPRFIMLTLLETSELPVAPVALSREAPKHGQRVFMFTSEQTAEPWESDAGELSIVDDGDVRGLHVLPTQWSTDGIYDERGALIGFNWTSATEIARLLDAHRVPYRLFK